MMEELIFPATDTMHEHCYLSDRLRNYRLPSTSVSLTKGSVVRCSRCFAHPCSRTAHTLRIAARAFADVMDRSASSIRASLLK